MFPGFSGERSSPLQDVSGPWGVGATSGRPQGARLFLGICGRAQLAPTGWAEIWGVGATSGRPQGGSCFLGFAGEHSSPLQGARLFLGICRRAKHAPTGCIRTLGCRGDQWSPAGGAVVSRVFGRAQLAPTSGTEIWVVGATCGHPQGGSCFPGFAGEHSSPLQGAKGSGSAFICLGYLSA